MTEKKERKKLNRYTTSKGRMKWPKLHAPDYGTKDYPKPDGVYGTKFIVDAKDPNVRVWLDPLQVEFDAAVEAGQAEYAKLKPETRKKLDKQGGLRINALYTELLDKETEEPTGEIEFNFTMKASGERKQGPKAGTRWNRKPDVFDGRGQRIAKVPEVWGGSEGRITFESSPYFVPGTATCGLSLKLEAVQITKLVKGGGRDAGEYGFAADEDGYAYDPADDAEDETSNSTKEQDGVASETEGDDDF